MTMTPKLSRRLAKLMDTLTFKNLGLKERRELIVRAEKAGFILTSH